MKAKIAIISAVMVLFAAHPVLAQDGGAAASTSANQMNNWMGTAEDIVQNIGNPMTGGSNMLTPDSQKSFNAKISCPNSEKYLEVFIQPISTGDLGTVYISHDTNYNGNYDYTLSLPFVVSGVCGNGIISCTPGTWASCVPMLWTTGTDGKVTLINTTWGNLGGCYCINNSCGSGLAWSNTATILRDLGGGVAAAIQKKDPKKVISAAKIQNFSITYYGQSTGSCKSAGGYAGMADPSSLFANGKSDALLAAQTDSEVQAESLDPASYYSILKASVATNMTNTNSCTISRKILVTKVENCPLGGAYDSGRKKCWAAPTTHTLSFAGCNHSCSGGSLIASGNTIYVSGCGCSITIPGATFTGNLYLGCDNSQPASLTNGCDQLGYAYGDYITSGCSTMTVTGVSVTGSVVSGWAGMAACAGGNWLGTGTPCPGSCMLYFTAPSTCPTGYTLVYDAQTGESCLADTTYSDNVTESIDDQCLAYETNSNCTLKTEKVDGVQTIQNFIPTYLSPFESCKTFTGYLSHSLCRQWWIKNHTYQCDTQSTNWDDLKKRTKKIYSTTSGDATQFQYGDVQYNGATWVNQAKTSTTGITGLDLNSGTCEKACKLRKPTCDNRAGAIGQAQQLQNSPTKYQYVYRSCAATGSCTVNADETMVISCQCINDFAEAATIFATIGAANKDAICSSGVKQ